MSKLIVFAVSEDGMPLLHSEIRAYCGDILVGRVVDSQGRGEFPLDLKKACRVEVDYQGRVETRCLAAGQNTTTVSFDGVTLGRPYLDLIKTNLPALVGILLLVLAVVLSFVFSHPNALQVFVIRAILALGAGGIASIIPGFFNANLGMGGKFAVTAGGALAVLLLIYAFNPPNLRDQSLDSPAAVRTS